MEADWEVEIGPGAPVIDANWTGFVDLLQIPEAAGRLPEVALLPALGDALIRLNGTESPVWTAKCDVWPLEDGEFDPDEMDVMDAVRDESLIGLGLYIDLLPRSHKPWMTAEDAVAFCRHLCRLLQALPLRNCRVDLIVRAAMLAPDALHSGITAYLTACGVAEDTARQALGSALNGFSAVVCAQTTIE